MCVTCWNRSSEGQRNGRGKLWGKRTLGCQGNSRTWQGKSGGKKGLSDVTSVPVLIYFRELPSISWSFFCLARIRPNPLRGEILYCDSITVIVSRFTALIENFVICCYQVTDFFCTWCWFTSSPSAKSPRNLGSLADLAILVCREVNLRNTVLPSCLFYWTFRPWVMRNVCGCWHFCVFELFCDVLQPLPKILQAVSTCSLAPVFLVLPRYFVNLLVYIRSMNPAAEELVFELDESPKTTKGTKVLRLACKILPLFGLVWLLTTGPVTSVPVFFEELT